MTALELTEQDRENARIRAEIAERQAAAYDECLGWALTAFGPGWLPSHRHFLVSKEEEERVRYTCERPEAAATVYTVRHEATGQTRHFTVDGDGRVTEHASTEEGFGPMLLEPHPTRRIEVRGQLVAPHRYSLCWAEFALYKPRTAEQLAALRLGRERGKAEREEKRWEEENPLLAWAARAKLEGDQEKER